MKTVLLVLFLIWAGGVIFFSVGFGRQEVRERTHWNLLTKIIFGLSMFAWPYMYPAARLGRLREKKVSTDDDI